MAKRHFRLDFSMYDKHVDSGIVELDDAVIEVVDDAWCAMFFCNLHTPERIAAHIGCNLVLNGLSLSQMDGWADQPDENARILEWPRLDDWDIEVEEVASEE